MATPGNAHPASREAVIASFSSSLRRALTLDNVLKLVGVIAALLYGVQFLAYRVYYVSLNTSPEDVGVNNSYILPRSLGFIALVCTIGALFFGLIWYHLSVRAPTSPHSHTANLLRSSVRTLLGLAMGITLSVLMINLIESPWLAVIIVLLVLGLPPALARISHIGGSATKGALVVALVVGAVMAIVIPTLSVVLRAGSYAEIAGRGISVRPFEIASIPLLDVAAARVTVDWTGPAETRPRELFGDAREAQQASGLLLGRGASTTIIRFTTPGRIVRLESGSVVIRFVDGP